MGFFKPVLSYSKEFLPSLTSGPLVITGTNTTSFGTWNSLGTTPSGFATKRIKFFVGQSVNGYNSWIDVGMGASSSQVSFGIYMQSSEMSINEFEFPIEVPPNTDLWARAASYSAASPQIALILYPDSDDLPSILPGSSIGIQISNVTTGFTLTPSGTSGVPGSWVYLGQTTNDMNRFYAYQSGSNGYGLFFGYDIGLGSSASSSPTNVLDSGFMCTSSGYSSINGHVSHKTHIPIGSFVWARCTLWSTSTATISFCLFGA